nr:MAG TPA: hypothetical protein [Caudoviricetes sp.]
MEAGLLGEYDKVEFILSMMFILFILVFRTPRREERRAERESFVILVDDERFVSASTTYVWVDLFFVGSHLIGWGPVTPN